MMRSWLVGATCLLGTAAGWAATSAVQPAALSEATQECIDCHAQSTPGIVHDWRASRHAVTTPAAALSRPAIERRMSAAQAPGTLSGVAVGCFECHGLRPGDHKDSFEHNGHQIHTVVSPPDCRTCHPTEVDQYAASKKAHAVENLISNPVFALLVEAIDGRLEVQAERLKAVPASESTKADTCLACHGTRVEVIGKRTVATDDGEMEFLLLSNWPNQGVGRINPDGSLGACTACHPRHGFSLQVARQPHTCGQCHLEPDVPAYNVYMESKHGNLFASLGGGWNWQQVPWRPGIDFQAPTCAVCHNALLADADGGELVARSHDFGARLWVRLFGLIYSHPQAKTGKTHTLRNADGQPLPVTFGGKLASEQLIDEQEQERRKALMSRVCSACHTGRWTQGHMQRLGHAIGETDQMVAAATELMDQAWKKRLADRALPFDESIERLWVRQWMFYANSIRYAAAMSGPDYATFKNGWFSLTENLRKLHDRVVKTAR
jgi:hypothetical protein